MSSIFQMLQQKISKTRLIWKLTASYLIVIFVGLSTLALAAELVAPTTFDRHMAGMESMMSGMQPGIGIQQLEADLFSNYRDAITEALVIATGVALVCAIAVSLFVSRRVVIPIRQMMQASRHIAAGHYHKRVTVTSRDELGELAQSFNQMAQTLERTETMRRELIANVTHELRTPLTSIKGYMEGLIDGVLPAQPATFQQVYREADRLQRLVNNLQELSRVEAGAFQLDKKRLEMTEIIQNIASRLHPQFDEKEVNLILNLPSNLLPVLADEDRMNQVLVNLMGNALHYTPTNGMVTVTAKANVSTLRIEVTDTGIGISAEHLPHVFARFYRVDKSRSRAGGGSGIGLTIAKHLVEAHNGEIWASSPGEGHGSTFGFFLPLL